jgi:hypothetical protein
MEKLLELRLRTIQKQKQLLLKKEQSAITQIAYTDELRNDNREMRTLLTRLYYASSRVLKVVTEHDPVSGERLGKEMRKTKARFLNQEHRN